MDTRLLLHIFTTNYVQYLFQMMADGICYSSA